MVLVHWLQSIWVTGPLCARWVLVVVENADADEGESDNMPRFVTRSGYVEIEDVPFLIMSIDCQQEALVLLLNDGTEDILDPERFFLAEDGVMYAEVKSGKAGAKEGEGHLAMLSRQAVFQISDLFEEGEDGGFVLQWKGERFPIKPRTASVE